MPWKYPTHHYYISSRRPPLRSVLAVFAGSLAHAALDLRVMLGRGLTESKGETPPTPDAMTKYDSLSIASLKYRTIRTSNWQIARMILPAFKAKGQKYL